MAFLSYGEIWQKTPMTLNEQINFFRVKTASVKGSAFLSHSSKDDDKVPGVVLFLGGYGIHVYVDDLDQRLPNPPSVQTAAILKDEIKQAARFIVLVSPNSRFSRWIPWELGLADGFKGVPPVAILPISPEGMEENWAKEEYFSLYPRIYRSGSEWYVLDPRDQKPWRLATWLTASAI